MTAPGSRRSRRPWVVLLGLAAVLCAALAPGVALAQSGRLNIERIGFDRPPQVKIYMTFVEGDGHSLVHGKKGEDFKLRIDNKEQGKPQALTIFERAREPIYLVVAVQLSPAMEPAINEVRQGLRVLADAVSRIPESRMSLLVYGENVKRLVDGGTATDIGAATSRMKIDPDGSTDVHMLDAVRTSVDILRGHDRGRRKMLVLFSDGTDIKGDKGAFTEAAELATQAGVVINSVGFAPFEPGRLRSLIDLAKATGGTARGCKSPDEIGARFTSVAAEVLRQYVGLFDLKLKGDGKPHVFQVVATGSDGKPVSSQEVKREVPVGIGGTARFLGGGGCGCRIGR